MPVFISHRTVDDELAKAAYNRLKSYHQIECYIDDIDKQLADARGTAEITQLIVDRLRSCTNLLAIVTENTGGSWWVPFEVGVAREAPRVITSLTNQTDRQLPEYLLEWPRLRGDSAIDTFAALYKKQRVLLNEHVIRKGVTASRQLTTVSGFQSELKRQLGQ